MLGTQEQRTKGMKTQAMELIDQAYMRGFKAGLEQGRKEGIERAAETVRRALSTDYNELNDAINRAYCNMPEKEDAE